LFAHAVGVVAILGDAPLAPLWSGSRVLLGGDAEQDHRLHIAGGAAAAHVVAGVSNLATGDRALRTVSDHPFRTRPDHNLAGTRRAAPGCWPAIPRSPAACAPRGTRAVVLCCETRVARGSDDGLSAMGHRRALAVAVCAVDWRSRCASCFVGI